MCALLLKGGTPQQFLKDAFQNLVTTYEDVVTFASIDSKTLLVTNLEEFLPEYSSGVHRFVLFKKVSGGLEVGKDGKAADGRLITSISTLDNNESISYGSVSKLIDGVKSGSKQMKKLSTLPVVNTRSKKLKNKNVKNVNVIKTNPKRKRKPPLLVVVPRRPRFKKMMVAKKVVKQNVNVDEKNIGRIIPIIEKRLQKK